MNALGALLAAFSYFTILPVRSFREAPGGAVVGWLPLVGACIGGLAGVAAWGVHLLAGATVWPPVVALVASIVFTGAIHLDGYLDSCDALLMSGAPARRRLDVMKDPHHGSYALAGMALVVVVWVAALSQLAPARMPLVLAAAALLSRAAVAPLLHQYPHARTNVTDPRARAYGFAWMAIVTIVACGFALSGDYRVAIAALVVYAIAQGLARWAASRLGGLTGDVYGAIVTLGEVAVLVVLR